MPRAVRVAAVAAVVVALCAALGVALTRSEARYAGFNAIRATAAVTTLEGGDEACQVIETVPAGTAAVQAVVATGGQPGPALRARVHTPSGETVTTGTRAGGYGDGRVDIPVRPLRRTVGYVTVCLRDDGTTPVQLVGVPTPNGGLEVNSVPHRGLLTLAYRRAGEETALSLLPVIAHRAGLGKSTIAGGWTLWALVGLFLASSAIALGLVLAPGFGREARWR